MPDEVKPPGMGTRVQRCVVLIGILALTGCFTQNGGIKQAVLGTSAGAPVIATPVLELPLVPRAFAQGNFQQALQGLPHGAQVSLDDAYQAAFGVSVSSPDVNPENGEVSNPRPSLPLFHAAGHPRTLNDAGIALGLIEHRYGMFDARYMICGLSLQRGVQSYLLVSLILRRWQSDTCDDSNPPSQATDTVLDWVVIDRRQFDDDKTYAFLLAASVRAILEHRRAPDYWDAVKQWQAGSIQQVLELSAQRARTLGAT